MVISRPAKCVVRAPPLPGATTPSVCKGVKNALFVAKFSLRSDPNVKIIGRLTLQSLPFTKMHAELKSDKPTPFHVHPHPLEGVGFGDV